MTTGSNDCLQLQLQELQVIMLCVCRAAAVSLATLPAPSLCRQLTTSAVTCHVMKLTRMRVVDNSELGRAAMTEGRPPRVIHVYNRTPVGTVGDKVLLAIKGLKKKGIVVGCVKTPNPMSMVPRFDSNNVVLIDDSGTPLGTRILSPLPNVIRARLKRMSHKKSGDFTKLLSLATHFV